jgi:hypothetical protein
MGTVQRALGVHCLLAEMTANLLQRGVLWLSVPEEPDLLSRKHVMCAFGPSARVGHLSTLATPRASFTSLC